MSRTDTNNRYFFRCQFQLRISTKIKSISINKNYSYFYTLLFKKLFEIFFRIFICKIKFEKKISEIMLVANGHFTIANKFTQFFHIKNNSNEKKAHLVIYDES